MTKIILAALVAVGLSAFANEPSSDSMDEATPVHEGMEHTGDDMGAATEGAATTAPGKKVAKNAKKAIKGKKEEKKKAAHGH